MKCGCGGDIKDGDGCITYMGSDNHDHDCEQEMFMRAGGLGFGMDMEAGPAMMSAHLQDHGLSFEDIEAILLAPRQASTSPTPLDR